ncbi:MAG: hypothetical protein COA78_13735 [Blastopirellula sp.]|nr:MAG: hypothetical protein COA78_13735 [Blastopirellula sp.]
MMTTQPQTCNFLNLAGLPWLSFVLLLLAQATAFAEEPKLIPVKDYESTRPDGRFQSSLGYVHQYIGMTTPKLSLPDSLTESEFVAWRSKVRTKLRELMAFPDVPSQPDPKKLWSKPREGYTLEKWEIYPAPGSVVPILMLVPEGTSSKSPKPVVFCFPGSSGTKEYLANEPEAHPQLKVAAHEEKNRIAFEFVKAGMIAIAMDHPGSGELSLLQDGKILGGATRDKLSRDLLYMGWSFVGLSTFEKYQTLQWVKTLDYVDTKRIALCGHSLGTEPAMALAVLDEDVSALILNDFVHGKREQDLSLAPSMDGKRIYFTGGMWHTVGGLWKWFDLPDLVAATAPRAVLATEGGVKHSLDDVKRAYALSGAPDNFHVRFMPSFDDPAKRPHDLEPVMNGLHIADYYRRSNTNPAEHYFKGHHAVPWLMEQFEIK